MDIPGFGKQANHFTFWDKAFIRKRDEQVRACRRLNELIHGRCKRTPGVIRALACPAVNTLTRRSVDLRGIPADKRFPYMVVTKVAVLVIGRVEIGEIRICRGRCKGGIHAGSTAFTMLTLGEHTGQSQTYWVEGPRRPLLDISHLQACRAVDPVCGFH